MNTNFVDMAVDAELKIPANGYGVDKVSKFRELYAELIVQKCIELCETKIKTYSVNGKEYTVNKNVTMEDCVASIKEYFGIKQ